MPNLTTFTRAANNTALLRHPLPTTNSFIQRSAFASTPQTPPTLAQWRTQRSTVQQHLLQTLVCSLDTLKDEELLAELERLCNELIDYVSLGHSSIFTQRKRAEARGSATSKGIKGDIHRHIGISTDKVLSFNEKYELARSRTWPGTLHTDLLKLHRSLSLRFALEEQLLVL